VKTSEKRFGGAGQLMLISLLLFTLGTTFVVITTRLLFCIAIVRLLRLRGRKSHSGEHTRLRRIRSSVLVVFQFPLKLFNPRFLFSLTHWLVLLRLGNTAFRHRRRLRRRAVRLDFSTAWGMLLNKLQELIKDIVWKLIDVEFQLSIVTLSLNDVSFYSIYGTIISANLL
jgi:hypothetical protein